MADVADTNPGAARQPWRAALAVSALAVAGLTAFQLAPDARVLGEISYDLAFAVAGFAATRRMRAGAPLAEAWAAAVRWTLPALVVVVIAVLALGAVLLPPADLRSQAETAQWSALGVAGLHLLGQGPDDPATSGELLQHLWAPGVAAQLFVAWTLAMAVLIRRGRIGWTGRLAGLGALLSLGLELWMRGRGLELHAFYLAPANAWPFLAGAAVAALPGLAGRPGPAGRPGLAGLAALAWPFHLWLWPLATLPRMILARPLTLAETAAVLILTILLALATRRGVEIPLGRRRPDGARPVLLAGAASLLGLVLVAGAVLAADGLPGRADARLRAEEAVLRQGSPFQAACHVEPPQRRPASDCTIPAGGPADVVVWGNSHAAHLTPAILDWTAPRSLRLRQATRSGCPALLVSTGGLAEPGCLAFNRAAVREMGEGPPPRLVLLGAAWTVILARSPGDDRVQAQALERDLTATVRQVRAAVGPDAGIVLLGNTPDFAFVPAACHARRRFLGLDTRRCDRARPANARMAGVVDGVLARVADGQPGVHFFDPSAALCREGLCRTRGPDGPWYADRHHMTPAGGRAQSAALAAVLDGAWAGRGR